ncbi:hypothetical protein MTR62_19545, partial [Novosphingobium sp. 1949]
MIDRPSPPPAQRRVLRGALVATLLAGSPAGLVLPTLAQAQDNGVAALIEQAKYWRAKGREDLAQQALRRARAIDPDNPALAAAAKAPTPSPKPAKKDTAQTTQPAARANTPDPAR